MNTRLTGETVDREITILLTDDESGHRRLIQRNLRRAGVANEILEFGDGEDVWTFLDAHRNTVADYLLLLDLQMPRLPGMRLLERLKADADLRPLPVVVLTTSDDDAELDRCQRLGCTACVTKPVDYADFVTTVKALGGFLQGLSWPATP